jgi:DNA-binding MarR family transcriptional regulator
MTMRSDVGTGIEGEARRLRAGIRALVRRFAISERADTSCCGMTVAQAATLETLGAEGSMTLGALGRRLGIAPSTLTRNLERLQEKGLVARRPSDGDARSFEVALRSDAGPRLGWIAARRPSPDRSSTGCRRSGAGGRSPASRISWARCGPRPSAAARVRSTT